MFFVNKTFTQPRISIFSESDRLSAVNKYFLQTGASKPESRGGPRLRKNEVTESIIAFIQKLKVRESHYGRQKTSKQYLPSDLN